MKNTMYSIEITQFAEFDIRESIEWYNKAKHGLGNRFYNNVKSTLLRIQENPKHFPIRYKSVRTVSINKFPFLIHYKINESEKIIVVLGVIHTSRNPNIWDDRSE